MKLQSKDERRRRTMELMELREEWMEQDELLIVDMDMCDDATEM
jgi:hypothetical protein